MSISVTFNPSCLFLHLPFLFLSREIPAFPGLCSQLCCCFVSSPWIITSILLATTNRIFRRKQWQATPVLLPRKSHGWRSLVGCSPWVCYESDVTEWLRFHFSLSRNGEGNGNPLQCSCLENPRDGRTWWADVYGVTQSRTQLKRLSSSNRIFTPWERSGESALPTIVLYFQLPSWCLETEPLIFFIDQIDF